jgi:hypothetical protein
MNFTGVEAIAASSRDLIGRWGKGCAAVAHKRDGFS